VTRRDEQMEAHLLDTLVDALLVLGGIRVFETIGRAVKLVRSQGGKL
jgi:hypothetical protein